MTLLLAAAGAVAGAIVGSFLATLCIRWPKGEQVVAGRSRCDSCGRPLGALELVPLISALASRERCRGCGAPIDRLHPQVELAAAALGAIAMLLQPNLNGVALAAFWLLLLAPAVLDWKHFWLPDKLTLLLAAGGLLLGHCVSGATIGERLAGGLAGFLSLWGLSFGYRRLRGRDGLGAGDPKLFGAIGLWTGWAALPLIALIAAMVGIGAAVVLKRGRSDRMPFGTMLAVGAVLWSASVAAGAPPLLLR